MSKQIILLVIGLLLLTACGAPGTPEPTPTFTATPRPTFTPRPTPTPTPVSICPAPNLSADWVPPDQFDGYPGAIRAYLSAGGDTGNLLAILRNASSITDHWGGVFSIDLSGDGEPETVVSIIDPFSSDQSAGPSGQLLIYGCANRQAVLWYSNIAARPRPLSRIVQTGNFIAAPRGSQIAVQSARCSADTCMNQFDVLGWDGQTLVSLLAQPLDLPNGQYQLVQADADAPVEIQAQKGVIQSIGAGPQRTERQTWDWNGAQFVQTRSELSPIEYRIQAIYEADDAFMAGDTQRAADWYSRAITDEALKDWLTESGYAQVHDRDTLRAYARFRLLLIGLLRGDANAADQLAALTAEYPEGSPVNQTTRMAQLLWDKYQATQNWVETCAAVNMFANEEYQIVDDLGLFGYANRLYTSDDMCPIK